MSDAVLADKERLYRLQQDLLKTAVALIQVGLCLPGGPDLYPVGSLIAKAQSAAKSRLRTERIAITSETLVETSIGPVSVFALDADPVALKLLMVSLEQESPQGRLWDIDVIGPDGPVDRPSLGLEPRQCLVCDESAHVCRRLGAHRLAEVVAAARKLIEAGESGADSR